MSSHGVPRTERDRSPEQLKKEIEKINKYRALDSQLRIQTSESRYDSATLELTTKLLRINPEYYTVWNVRRRCLISGPLKKKKKGSLPQCALGRHETNKGLIDAPRSSPQTNSSDTDTKRERPATSERDAAPREKQKHENEVDASQCSETVRDELKFTVPLLLAHPKCYWIWNYRMWVLEQATSLLSVKVAKSVWQEELELVGKMLDRDRRNYHAWAYRRYVVSHLESAELEGRSLAESEFAYTTKMIGGDLSNFSAWHNRAQLIPRLLVEREADSSSRRTFLDQELDMVDNGLNVGPEDQSLWYYHQYLIWSIAEQPANLLILPEMALDDRVNLIIREIDFIKDLLDDYKDVKWIFEMLLEYTLLISKLRNESLNTDQKCELEGWILRIKTLDPQRSHRWEELTEKLKISP